MKHNYKSPGVRDNDAGFFKPACANVFICNMLQKFTCCIVYFLNIYYTW